MHSTVNVIFKTAFKNCSSLKTVILPPNLKSIGKRAFQNCSSICEIDFPPSLKAIGESAFANCSSLKKIKFVPKLLSIGERAFYGCFSLTEVVLPSAINYIGKQSFDLCDSVVSFEIERNSCDTYACKIDVNEGNDSYEIELYHRDFICKENIPLLKLQDIQCFTRYFYLGKTFKKISLPLSKINVIKL